MGGAQTDRLLRWIEGGLVALGSVCLLWVGAISMHAVTYQVEQNARLARLAPVSDHLAVDGGSPIVAPPPEAAVPIGRLEIPRIGYPFNFVGRASQRFVIHAERIVETSDSRQTRAGQQGGGVP